jgi:hypothetical protein
MSQAWLNQITEFASESQWMVKTYGGLAFDPKGFQRHHIEGRKSKRKIDGVSQIIGEWYVIAIPFMLHDVHSNHPQSVTHAKRVFEATFGTQKDLFFDMVNSMIDYGYDVLLPSEVINAI